MELRIEHTPVTLVAGHAYNMDALRFVGWTNGDGTSTDAYCVEEYFDVRGRYRGPDHHGIEPMFAVIDPRRASEGGKA